MPRPSRPTGSRPGAVRGAGVHAVAEPVEGVPGRAAQGGPLIRRPGAVPRTRTAEVLLEELPQRAEFVGRAHRYEDPLGLALPTCRTAVLLLVDDPGGGRHHHIQPVGGRTVGVEEHMARGRHGVGVAGTGRVLNGFSGPPVRLPRATTPGQAGILAARSVGLGWRPSGISAEARTRTVIQPCQWPSGPGPQARSTCRSSAANGIQSIPRSRSQARTAAAGCGRPFRFSYAATVTQSSVPVPGRFMTAIMPECLRHDRKRLRNQ